MSSSLCVLRPYQLFESICWMPTGRKEFCLPSTLGAESKFPSVSITKSVYVLLTLPHYSKGFLKNSSVSTNAFCGRRWWCYSPWMQIPRSPSKSPSQAQHWVLRLKPVLSLICLSPIFLEHHSLDKEWSCD